MPPKNILVAVYGRHSIIRRDFVKLLKKKLIASGTDAFFLGPVYFEEMDQTHGLYLRSDLSSAKNRFKSGLETEIKSECHRGLNQSLEEGERRVILVDNYIDALKVWDALLHAKEAGRIAELEARYPKTSVSILVDHNISPISFNKETGNQQEKLAENVRAHYQKLARKENWLIVSDGNQIPNIVYSINMMLPKEGKKEYEVPQSAGSW